MARDVPRFHRGRRLLDEACRLVALAHPFRYEDPIAALEVAEELDAIERYYPYDHAVDNELLDRRLATAGLLPVGGSDAHDHRLGRAGIDEEEYGRVAERLRPAR